MKGDFSKWKHPVDLHSQGVLQQQGRVFLDSDWNSQVLLNEHWQRTAGQDIIGMGIAAVPASQPDGWAVLLAQVADGKVRLSLEPGRVWVDGIAAELEPAKAGSQAERDARYWPEGSAQVSDIRASVRDAVILEVWQESLNAFQVPDQLLEPALGGPDTTERLQTCTRLALLRLGPDDDCRTVIPKLRDDFTKRGRLKVSLRPPQDLGEIDCPVADPGGYTGFEHNLYRVEIAAVSGSQAMFKWSQANGGLVGRGDWDAADPAAKKITITHNLAAIASCGLDSFYCEILTYDEARGYWRVLYGAEAVLNGQVLDLGSEWCLESTLPSGNVFFRLWNGIRPLTDFPTAAEPADAVELRDGIRLEFDLAAGSPLPGDYWTFPVRAGEVKNPEVLIDFLPPQGICYHRASLGILEWDSDLRADRNQDEVLDCRQIFRPLTNQKVCCTYLVGDGRQSQGDFNSLEEAVAHLPAGGGQICLMPGVHEANLSLEGKKHIRFTGCGSRTIVRPRPGNPQLPVISLSGCAYIEIDSMAVVHLAGTPIRGTKVFELALHDTILLGLTGGVQLSQSVNVSLADNRIFIINRQGGGVAVFLQARNSRIDRNEIAVLRKAEVANPGDPDDPSPGVWDLCAEPETVYENNRVTITLIRNVMESANRRELLTHETHPFKARGGIQIGSSSMAVRIRDNRIRGGYGDGVTLGHLPLEGETSHGYEKMDQAKLAMMKEKFEGFIYDLVIGGNEIVQMGANGIGVVSYFDLKNLPYLISLSGGEIRNNRIIRCLQQFPELPPRLLRKIGLGGISLADAENVAITENWIEENGTSHIEPVCGIFILQGERIDVSRNRILNNGPWKEEAGWDLRLGVRGGIVIMRNLQLRLPGGAMAGGMLGGASHGSLTHKTLQPITNRAEGAGIGINPGAGFSVLEQSLGEVFFHNSVPAATVHDNLVVQPIGRALLLLAMGPVSVANNHFTSQGVEPGASSTPGLGAAVLIVDLGIAKDVWAGTMISSVAVLPQVQLQQSGVYKRMIRNLDTAAEATNASGMAVNSGLQLSLEVLEALQALPSGQVLFNDNRTLLDLRLVKVDQILAGQVIGTLDDLSYSGNQSECEGLMDVILTDAFLAGMTIRTCNNRFQEGVGSQVYFSLLSLGNVNTAADNQATNCLVALAKPAYRKVHDNVVLYEAACKAKLKLLAAQLKIIRPGEDLQDTVNLIQ